MTAIFLERAAVALAMTLPNTTAEEVQHVFGRFVDKYGQELIAEAFRKFAASGIIHPAHPVEVMFEMAEHGAFPLNLPDGSANLEGLNALLRVKGGT